MKPISRTNVKSLYNDEVGSELECQDRLYKEIAVKWKVCNRVMFEFDDVSEALVCKEGQILWHHASYVIYSGDGYDFFFVSGFVSVNFRKMTAYLFV